MEKKALGKGLEALLPTVQFKAPTLPTTDVQEILLTQIIPNRYQPRTTFSEDEISELSESIKKNGLIQPVMVRRKGDGIYELIAGERRFRIQRFFLSLPRYGDRRALQGRRVVDNRQHMALCRRAVLSVVFRSRRSR